MHIIAVGLNFRTAPVEIREKLSFNEQELASAMKTLSGQKSILENIIVSTCNRTEIYAVVDQLHTGRYYVKAFLAEWFGIDKEEFSPYLTIYENDGAIEHLYRVACGLDSMVIGETQILGQVRSSFLLAQEEETIGTVFNQLFKQAVTLAKKAHHETEIGANAVSVSYAAVELAKKIFGDLSSKHVLILGAGKMGQLAVQNLYGSGAKKVTVVNRTFEKAQELANRFSGEAKPFADLQHVLSEADILISSTGANDYVVTKQMMSEAERMRKGRPLFMVDIAVPRDLDPELDELETVFLYDIDDLNGIVESNLQERQKAADEIEIMLEAEIVAFKSWLGTLGVVPVISALRQKALTIQAETMKSIDRKLPDLSERERKVLNKHTKSIINQLLRDPILHAKELAGEKHAEESLELFMKIFNIEQEVALQKEKEEQLRTSITSHSVAYQS
ncbi:glutamyl-tRNA reductase [Priestia megaterium]|uniref:glutamyl-tRNA reductase n=1 Tax=Priestia megaterium TaxID=1404 RepID=UPI000471E167|nr:glutamyl-tRNA reductase [Priestia megaterium]PFA96600.1 glutamyl-tRNA reductase [Priestia megaterium]PFR95739.1 glutamyl-tRNA reductase [Priestia megaterium]TCN15413.1 glutamyl-tRNA reductase [Bacillus sp. BK006]